MCPGLIEKHEKHSSLSTPSPPRRACRFCNAPLSMVVVDLGVSPLCESYLSAEQLDGPEMFYPLTVYVCDHCLLVQLPVFVSGEEIFSEYAYFSSYSTSWLAHARKSAESLIERFGIGPASHVIEIASNDGYMLRNFVERGISCLGIEPAANVAQVAQQQGIPTLVEFFGARTARQAAQSGRRPDLLLANNVLAHVPNLNDFVSGIKMLLAADGVGVFEIQYLLRLFERNQFDTIYHEHFYYYTLGSLCRVMAAHGLKVFDAEEIPTHGGSIRIYVRHEEAPAPAVESSVERLLSLEREAALTSPAGYANFAPRVERIKRDLLAFLIDARRSGKSVAAYGAPGKGNTLLNYCGIRQDLVQFTVDRNPYKQGKFLPGTRIPIFSPEHIERAQPDYVLILPWNLREEIVEQLEYVRRWKAKFVVPIPQLEIF